MMGSIPSFTISFTQDVCTVSNLLTYGERLSIPFVTFHDTQKVLNAHFVPSLQGMGMHLVWIWCRFSSFVVGH